MNAKLFFQVVAASSLILLSACSETGSEPIASQASATLSTSAVAFGSSPVGMTSATQSITLTNSGSTSMLLNGVSVTGTNLNAFLATSNCPVQPAQLLRGSSCTVSVAFAPTGTGFLTATLLISDNAISSPQSVTLTGTGTSNGPIVSFSATSVTFTTLPVGQASTQTITMSNIGSSSLSLYGFTVGGANATSFAVSGPCLTTGTLAASSSCSLTITYAPTVAGSLSATINANDSAPNSPQTIALASK